MGFLSLISYILAIIITPTFRAAGMQAFEDPQKIENIIFFLIVVFVSTLVVLVLAKFKLKNVIKIFFLCAVTITIFYVLSPIIRIFTPHFFWVAAIISILAICLLYKYPEWYVINAICVIIAAGACSIFGISLAILPAILLLIALSIYDAISVYKTKHMIDLADNVVDLKLPILLVIPKKSKYSYLKQEPLKQQITDKKESEAFFMGLGDIVIPGILVISAYRFISEPFNIFVSVVTIFGIMIGYSVLTLLVSKGKPHAGLPLLNSGAIIGYLLSYYILFKDLSFGLI